MGLNMNKSKILIIFLAFLISISCAYSIVDDFVVVSDDYELDVCRCGSVQSTIKIGNTGSVDNIYTTYQAGKAKEFSLLSEGRFKLDSGDVKEIVEVINVPCDTGTGDYELKTYVTSAFGLKKVLNQIINVKKCVIKIKVDKPSEDEGKEEEKEPAEEKEDKIEEAEIKGFAISLPKREDEICSGEKTIYNIAIKSEKAGSITMSSSGPEWVELGWTNVIELNDNDEKNINLIADPGSDVDGREEIQIIAKNSQGVMVDKTSIVLDVVPQEKCNKVKILSDEFVINQTQESINIEIENLGDRKGEFDVVVEGPEWIATQKTVTLDGEEIKNISIDLSLDETVEDGKYEIDVDVMKGDKTIYSKEIDVHVGEKRFDFASFLLSLMIVLIIVVLVIVGIVIINRREREELSDIRIEVEEEKPKRTSNKAAATRKVKKKKAKKKKKRK